MNSEIAIEVRQKILDCIADLKKAGEESHGYELVFASLKLCEALAFFDRYMEQYVNIIWVI